MKKVLTCLFAVLGLSTACGQANFENYDVKEFAELIADSNVVILDVRKADEFAEGHIKGAILSVGLASLIILLISLRLLYLY